MSWTAWLAVDAHLDRAGLDWTGYAGTHTRKPH